MKRKFLIIPFAIGSFALLLWLTNDIPYCGNDFLKALWGPVNMLVQNQTPYSYNQPYGPYPGVWMPTVLGAFFPIGYLSCHVASKIWLAVEMIGFVWVIWMIAGYKLPSPWLFAVCLFTLFLFPPLWIHIRLGQFSMLFVILMMLVVYIPQVDRIIPLLLVIGLTKPQLGILIYPGLLLHIWRKSGFRPAARLVLTTGVIAVLLTIPLFLYYPGWLGDFLFITFDNLGKAWNLPTLFVQLPVRFGITGYLVWALVFLTTFATSLWLWANKDPKFAVLASLAFTPMVTTYASSWDFLLLLPAFFWLVIHLKSNMARAVLLSGMLFVFIAQMAPRLESKVSDGTQWWIPPVLILLYLVSMAVEKFRANNRNVALEQRLAQ